MKRMLWVFFISCFFFHISYAQTSISGVINDYAKVTLIDTLCQSKLTVDDTTGFEVGKKVILIQMKGATIDESNSSSFGDVTDLGSSGLYEQNEVDSINATCIFLKYKLLHDYNVNGKVQLVTMPWYDNAIVSDTLRADPWNGDKGGILTFIVENDLVLNENIDVSGMGFRGGTSVSVNPNNCSWLNQQNDYFYNLNNWRAAEKGEGAANFIAGKEAGKGAQFNGGGGGNDHNSGGGGGSNPSISTGGKGGENNEPATFGCKGLHPGNGGKNSSVDTLRIYLGGGGGAGHGNNDLGTNGGKGGGIVILEAGNISANNFNIISNGEYALDGGGDGAGGGGSGGTFVMKIDVVNDFLNLESIGGNGGSIDNQGAQRCHGPGGGGGGGQLFINPGLPYGLNSDGGLAGQSTNSGSCPDSSNGAENGSQGSFEELFEIPQSTSQSGTLTIINQPVSQNVCEGNQAFFSLIVDGTPSNYQWQVDDGSGFQDISDGATYSGTMTDSLIVLNPTILMSGWVFQCIVSNACGQLISESATLSVFESASILNQPESLSICEGDNAAFSIIAIGSNIQYQWQVDDGSGFQNISDGAVYSGTMTDTLTILNPTILMSGWIFQCSIMTDCGDLVSDAATLTVTQGATISNQPESITVCEGQSAGFSVSVIGSNVQFQWQVDDGSGFQNISDGAVYTGTMTDTLTILNPTILMSGWIFQCSIMTDCGDLVSDAATLTVTQGATISNQPESITVCEGQSAGFSVSVIGSNVQFQWQVDDGSGFQNISDGAVYSGTMTDSLTVLNPTILMSGWIFQCLIFTDCGDLVSDAATLMVTQGATISNQPESITICEGQSTGFSVSVIGSNVQFQWQVDDGSGFQNISDGAVYTGTMTETLTILNPTILMSGWIFQCLIFTDCGDLVSDAATLTVTQGATITNQPESITVCEGQSAGFSVSVIGSNVQFQWQADDGSGFQNISDGAVYTGTMTDTLTILNPTILMSGWIFQCLIFTDCGDLVSNAATLTVTQGATISNQPESIAVCEGQSAGFSVSVIGSNVQFQWQADDGSGFQNISDGAVYTGTMTDTLTILNPTILMSGWIFQCLIFTDCGDLVSNAATLTVTQGATISNQPESITVCEGQSAGFSVSVIGSNVQYQWQTDDGSGFQNISDGAVYTGTMTDTLTIQNPTILMSGWIFQCLIFTDCGDLVSDAATLTVTQGATISNQPESITVCEGQSAGFSVSVIGSNVQFQWQVDDGSGFQNISDGAVYTGTMTDTLTILNPTILMSGWIFQCLIFTDCGDLVSQGANLLVTENVNIISQPASVMVCAGESSGFSVSATGSNIQFQWQVDDGTGFVNLSNGPIYSNVNTATLSILVAGIPMDGNFYRCVINHDCGAIISESAEMIVETVPTAQFNYLINGSSVDFNNMSSANSNSYEWDFGDNSTSNEVDPTHNYTQSGIYTVQLIASNNCGSDTTTQDIEISFLEAPVAGFTLNNGTGCAPLLVQFTDQSVGIIDSWNWTFPGGNPANSSDQNPQVIYDTPGLFDVSLEVTNSAGSDMIIYDDYIFIDFSIFAGYIYSVNVNTVSFTNTSQNALTFEWNFGDNSPVSYEENPIHEYAQPGVYLVTLVTTNPLCGSAVTQAVDVLFTAVEKNGNEVLFEVFPNPVNNILFIKFSKNDSAKKIRLFNSNGQIILENKDFENENAEIDFSEYPQGMYLLEILINDIIFVEKIIKF